MLGAREWTKDSRTILRERQTQHRFYFTMDQYSHDVDLTLLAWSSKQAHILTGAGTLDDLFLPGRDFEVSELPHYHLQQVSVDISFHP